MRHTVARHGVTGRRAVDQQENLCGAVQRAVELAPPGYIGDEDGAKSTKLGSACLCTACTRLLRVDLPVPDTAVWRWSHRWALGLLQTQANMMNMMRCVAEAAQSPYQNLEHSPQGNLGRIGECRGSTGSYGRIGVQPRGPGRFGEK
jgi:hypothetical protein